MADTRRSRSSSSDKSDIKLPEGDVLGQEKGYIGPGNPLAPPNEAFSQETDPTTSPSIAEQTAAVAAAAAAGAQTDTEGGDK